MEFSYGMNPEIHKELYTNESGLRKSGTVEKDMSLEATSQESHRAVSISDFIPQDFTGDNINQQSLILLHLIINYFSISWMASRRKFSWANPKSM